MGMILYRGCFRASLKFDEFIDNIKSRLECFPNGNGFELGVILGPYNFITKLIPVSVLILVMIWQKYTNI